MIRDSLFTGLISCLFWQEFTFDHKSQGVVGPAGTELCTSLNVCLCLTVHGPQEHNYRRTSCLRAPLWKGQEDMTIRGIRNGEGKRWGAGEEGISYKVPRGHLSVHVQQQAVKFRSSALKSRPEICLQTVLDILHLPVRIQYHSFSTPCHMPEG